MEGDSVQSTRGNALLMVLVALAVLSLLAVGAIRFTSVNRDAARAKDRGDRVASCVEVARRYLIAQLPANPLGAADGEINPGDETVTFERILPDNEVDLERSRAYTGHITNPVAQPTIVAISPMSLGSSRRQIRDIANNLGPQTLGGRNYRVVVSCVEPGTTRATELEFAFRFGI